MFALQPVSFNDIALLLCACVWLPLAHSFLSSNVVNLDFKKIIFFLLCDEQVRRDQLCLWVSSCVVFPRILQCFFVDSFLSLSFKSTCFIFQCLFQSTVYDERIYSYVCVLFCAINYTERKIKNKNRTNDIKCV